jgi:hypothetical protein
MQNLGYKPCKADRDLWYKAETRPDDGTEYYAYILLYVDDCLCVHHDPTKALKELDKYFMMKPDSIGDPDIYLGAKLRPVTLHNGVVAWGKSPSKYVQEACKDTELYLQKNYNGRKLKKKVSSPWPNGYESETDASPELSAELPTYFQSQIGVLQWIVELGRVDIVTEVSMLASQMALPREGHLEAVFEAFAYLQGKHNSRNVFDPTYPEIDESKFLPNDWKNFYRDVKEAIPIDAPEPRGKEDVCTWIWIMRQRSKRTRRSQTGYFIFMNSVLIAWLSKKQPTIETSVFVWRRICRIENRVGGNPRHQVSAANDGSSS